MSTFSFDKVNQIIEVAAPDTAVTIQQLINAIRDWEDELVNLEVARVADASGKDDLGGGLSVGITLRLLNWKVKFEDRTGPDWVDCGVTGGNLVAVDASNQPMNPIEPAAYVTVTVAKAVSAATVETGVSGLTEEESQQLGYITSVKTKTDNLPTDPASETKVAVVEASLDEAKHHGATFEPDKESLEAIRARIDEIYAKPTGAEGFNI